MKSSQFLEEGFVEDAHNVHQDHEVQMAREELYHSAESALRLHKLLRNVSEEHGLEGWVSAKITLANDYLKTVLEYMEYHLMTDASGEGDMSAEPVAEAVDAGEYDARKTTPSSKEKNDEVFRKHRERMKALDKDKKGVAEGIPAPIVKMLPRDKADFGKSGTVKNTKIRCVNCGGLFPEYMFQDGKCPECGANIPTPGQLPLDKNKARWAYDRLGHEPNQEPLAKKQGVAEDTSAGNVATVNNPTPKNKAKTGTLFGGTYQQPKAKAKK